MLPGEGGLSRVVSIVRESSGRSCTPLIQGGVRGACCHREGLGLALGAFREGCFHSRLAVFESGVGLVEGTSDRVILYFSLRKTCQWRERFSRTAA